MEFEMIWTAVLKKDGITSCTTFSADNNPEEAYRNIWKVMLADGYEIIGLIKGNHTQSFYGIDVRQNRVRAAVPVEITGV